jgi:hypothetical protein
MSLVKVTTNGHEVAIRMAAKVDGLHEKLGYRIKRMLRPVRKHSQKAARNRVYSRPENPDFKRSNNLVNSIATKHLTAPGKQTLRIWHNPALARRDFPWASKSNAEGWPDGLASYSGKYAYYPSYVLQGNFFGNRVSDNLDYMQDWEDLIVPIFVREMSKQALTVLVKRM